MKSIPLIALVLSAASLSANAEQKLNDAQIAAVVLTANQVDIEDGKFAAETSTDAAVKAFATTTVTDHTAVSKSAVELVTRLQVSPEENEASRALKAGGEKNLAALLSLQGKAFDKTYVDHEVTYHEQVIAP